MSLSQAPSIITNGLVFYYDVANVKKSWLGRPIINQFAIPTPDSSNNVNFQVQGNGIFQRVLSGNYGGYEISASDIVYKHILPNGIGCWYHGNDVTINSGQTATFSFDYYVDPSATGYPYTNYLANFEGVVSAAITDPTPTQIGVWKRLSFSATASSTGLCRMLLYPGACGGYLGTGGFVLFKNPQVEFDAPSNNPSPYVSGTRSTTQALIDIINNKTITINSLTYTSNGTFTFNGSSDYFSFPTIDFSGAQTIEIWLQPLENDGNRRNPYNQSYGGYGTWTHEPSGNFNFYYGDAGANNSPYVGHTSGFTVVQNEIACVCTTRNVSQSTWYKNGVFDSNYSHSFGTLTTDSNSIQIGAGYAGYYLGNIFAVKLYNRVLSASEVKQNFNALRSRFGL